MYLPLQIFQIWYLFMRSVKAFFLSEMCCTHVIELWFSRIDLTVSQLTNTISLKKILVKKTFHLYDNFSRLSFIIYRKGHSLQSPPSFPPGNTSEFKFRSITSHKNPQKRALKKKNKPMLYTRSKELLLQVLQPVGIKTKLVSLIFFVVGKSIFGSQCCIRR